jgi:hypothetical protein
MDILKTQVFSKEQRNKRNYLIHLLYVRKEFDECLLLIEDTLAQVNEVCARSISMRRLIASPRASLLVPNGAHARAHERQPKCCA